MGGSYVIQAGGYVGPLLIQLPANDPQVTQFGPSTVRLANGTTQPNPLATRIRFQGPTRSDGQIRNDDVKYLQLKIGRVFRFGNAVDRAVGEHLQHVQHRGELPVEHRREPAVQPELPGAVQPASAAFAAAVARVQVLDQVG